MGEAKREQMKIALLDVGERMLARKDRMNVIADEKDKEFKLWQEDTPEGPKTVVQYRADGLTPQLYQAFTYNAPTELPKIMTNFTIKPIA